VVVDAECDSGGRRPLDGVVNAEEARFFDLPRAVERGRF
jgi:hypothetical protein